MLARLCNDAGEDPTRVSPRPPSQVDLIAARVPLESAERIAFAAAMHYPTLLRLREVAARVEFVDPARALKAVEEKRVPLEAREGKIVVPERDPTAVLLFLSSTKGTSP